MGTVQAADEWHMQITDHVQKITRTQILWDIEVQKVPATQARKSDLILIHKKERTAVFCRCKRKQKTGFCERTGKGLAGKVGIEANLS